MRKGMKGMVVGVRPELAADRLHVVAAVKTESGEVMQAHMPDREMAAILPRSVLLGEGNKAPVSLLDTVQPILSRMTEGRSVRIWLFKDRWFFSFQPWRSVRFVPDQAPADAE